MDSVSICGMLTNQWIENWQKDLKKLINYALWKPEAGQDFPQEPGNQVPSKFFHWQEILDEIPRISKEILVRIFPHLKEIMSYKLDWGALMSQP